MDAASAERADRLSDLMEKRTYWQRLGQRVLTATFGAAAPATPEPAPEDAALYRGARVDPIAHARETAYAKQGCLGEGPRVADCEHGVALRAAHRAREATGRRRALSAQGEAPNGHQIAPANTETVVREEMAKAGQLEALDRALDNEGSATPSPRPYTAQTARARLRRSSQSTLTATNVCASSMPRTASRRVSSR